MEVELPEGRNQHIGILRSVRAYNNGVIQSMADTSTAVGAKFFQGPQPRPMECLNDVRVYG